MASIRAAVCNAFGKPLVVEDLELDGPRPGEIEVRLAACAICHSDIHAMEGAWGGALPVVYGHEAAGVVDSVGPGVDGVRRGNHVVVTLIRSCGHCYFCAQGDSHLCEGSFALDGESRLARRDGERVHQGLYTGAFAERVVVDQSQVVPIARDVPLESASLLACGVITGVGAVLNTARVPAGSSVAVIGTGGVGLNSVQGARLCGAHPIVGIDVQDAKLAAATAFGATHIINPISRDMGEVLRSLTAGRGVDYVFVTVGSVRAVEQGLTLLRRGGTLVVVGMPPAGAMAGLEVLELAYRSQRVLGSRMGSTRLRIDVPRLVDLYRQGRLRLDELVTGRFGLEQINEAVAQVNAGDALRNVVVF